MTNTSLLDKILELNPGITNLHLIRPSQKIKIPAISERSLILLSSDSTFKIHLGTFQQAGYANLYRGEPALKGKLIQVIPKKVSPAETWYRTIVGTFIDEDECLRVIAILKEKGLLPIFSDAGKKG